MYRDFFKFKGRPFGLSPEPKFFFNSATHRQAFQCIGEGLEHGQGVITVTGEPGTGKTTLVLGLEHMLTDTDVITACIHNTQLETDDMLRYVVAQFGLPYEDYSKVTLLKVLEDFFENCRSHKKRALLIIDESHNLTRPAIEELRMLLNLFEGKKPLLQYVLFGQPRFFDDSIPEEVIKPLLQKVVTSYHLVCMDNVETRAYIEHRLRIAGWKGKPSISTDAFTSIYDHTLGNPAEVNMLCLKLLEAAACVNSHKIDRQLVQWVVHEITNQHKDVNFSGTVLEKLVENYVHDDHEAEPEPNMNLDEILQAKNELGAGEEQELDYPSFEDKSDEEKEQEIKTWLSRKEDDTEEPQEAQLENLKTEEVSDAAESESEESNIALLFPEGTKEEEIEEIIY